jgi:hypothetical protein
MEVKVKRIIAIVLILIAVANIIPAQAGKPKPTPYPLPEAENDAYPAPGAGLPAPQLPAAPAEFCDTPEKPCAWGYFGKWYVTASPVPLMTMEYGMLCINAIGTGIDRCYEIGFESYNNQTYTLLYSANPTRGMCNRWWRILSVFWLGQWADIRTPNEYWIGCTGLPFSTRSMLDWFELLLRFPNNF